MSSRPSPTSRIGERDYFVEMHKYRGRKHREGGPAEIVRCAATGIVVEERYYWHGRLHRLDGPARLEYNGKGVVTLEMYFIYGSLHVDREGPAWIERDEAGTVVIAEPEFEPPRRRA